MKFKENQTIFYPLHGIGLVREITPIDVHGTLVPYYVIHIQSSDMLIKIPTSNVAKIGLRPLSKASVCHAALNSFDEDKEIIYTDWKIRYQNLHNLLKEGSLESSVCIIQTLYHRSNIKELPLQEKKIYDVAWSSFFSEVSLVLKKQKATLEQAIHAKLMQKNQQKLKKQSINTLVDLDE